MKMWWRLWAGHVLFLPFLGSLAVTLYFLWLAVRGMTEMTILWYFFCTVLCGLATLGWGVLSAWTWKTHAQRVYLRGEDALLADDLPPVDATEIVAELSDTDPEYSLVSEAHSAGEDDNNG